VKITFLGTGTSQGVPVITCECPICGSSDEHDKRLRTSLLLELNGKVLLFDAGPDFRQQMLRANVKKLDSIILTHEHKDHIAGMDDVRAYNFKSQDAVDIFAEERVQKAIKKEFSSAKLCARKNKMPCLCIWGAVSCRTHLNSGNYQPKSVLFA